MSKQLIKKWLIAVLALGLSTSALANDEVRKLNDNPNYWAFPGGVNVYGYSKLLFDNYVRNLNAKINSQVVGLRYFNVFGPGENHKKSMASVIYHFNNQIKETGELKLFEGSHGYADGEQLRDFISVNDVVAVNLWLMSKPDVSGIFNVGTGQSNSFNNVANAVVDWHKKGKINYIPFPDSLKNAYQSFTEANLNKLRSAGYDQEFTSLKDGVSSYLNILNSNRI